MSCNTHKVWRGRRGRRRGKRKRRKKKRLTLKRKGFSWYFSCIHYLSFPFPFVPADGHLREESGRMLAYVVAASTQLTAPNTGHFLPILFIYPFPFHLYYFDSLLTSFVQTDTHTHTDYILKELIPMLKDPLFQRLRCKRTWQPPAGTVLPQARPVAAIIAGMGRRECQCGKGCGGSAVLLHRASKMAIQFDKKWAKSWHWWALVNFDIVSEINMVKRTKSGARSCSPFSHFPTFPFLKFPFLRFPISFLKVPRLISASMAGRKQQLPLHLTRLASANPQRSQATKRQCCLQCMASSSPSLWATQPTYSTHCVSSPFGSATPPHTVSWKVPLQAGLRR